MGRSPSKRTQSKRQKQLEPEPDEEEEDEEGSVIESVVDARVGKGRRRMFLVHFKDQPEAARRWEARAFVESKGPAAAALVDAYEEEEEKNAGAKKNERAKSAPRRAPPPKRAKKAAPAEENEEFPGDEDDDEFEGDVGEGEGEEGSESESEAEAEVAPVKRRPGRPRKNVEEDEEDDEEDEPRGRGRGKRVAGGARAKCAPAKGAKKQKTPKTRLDEHFIAPMWRMGTVATMLHIPHDVMKARLLPYLGWADARSLSRVCLALREDALLHMTKLAREKFGQYVRGDDPKELNLAMACMVHLGDQTFSKAHAMRDFCISDAVARNMTNGAVQRGRRMVFLPEQVIAASLQRHKTLSSMLQYKQRLNSNRNTKAQLRALAPDRLRQVNEALQAVGTSWDQIPYGIDGYWLAQRWIKNGTGNAKMSIEGIVKGVQKRNLETARKMELRFACEARGIEMPHDNRPSYSYMMEQDDIETAVLSYASSNISLEAGMAAVQAVVDKRERRRGHVMSLVERLGLTWEQVTTSHGTPDNAWSFGSNGQALVRNAEQTLARYVKCGDVATGLRALELAFSKRVSNILGPQAEKALREEEGFDVEMLKPSLKRAVIHEVETQREVLVRGMPLNRRHPVFAFPLADPEVEALAARGENPLTEHAHLEYPTVEDVVQLIRDQVVVRRRRTDEALAISDQACSIRELFVEADALISTNAFIDGMMSRAEVLRVEAKMLRVDVIYCDTLMRDMMELSGEDFATLGRPEMNLQGAALADVTVGSRPATVLMADVLLRGVQWHPAASSGDLDALVADAVSFGLEHASEWTNKNRMGRAQDWHADPVGRAHLKLLPEVDESTRIAIESDALSSMCMVSFGADAAIAGRGSGPKRERAVLDLSRYFGEPISALSCSFNPVSPTRFQKRNSPLSPFFPNIIPVRDDGGRARRGFVTYPRDLPTVLRIVEFESGVVMESYLDSSEDAFAARDSIYSYGGGYGGDNYGHGYGGESDDYESDSSDQFFNHFMMHNHLHLHHMHHMFAGDD